jgi:NAD(P)-dependent dehydrogenase (short-subunit alcohol dehydrogenase family)
VVRPALRVEVVLGANLWGVIHGIRAFLPVLAAQSEGHIVNTASIAGLIPGTGPIYDATKHGVVAISETTSRVQPQ